MTPDTLDDTLDVLRDSPELWTIFISPRRTYGESRRLIYRARACLEESLVAFHVTDLSPLGVEVLTEMAQPLLKALPSRQILPALSILESQIRCLTVTNTVVDMREPKVPLWLHARSWIPGGTYIAERQGSIRGISRRKPEKALHHFDIAEQGRIAVVAESVGSKPANVRVNATVDVLLEHLGPDNVVERANPEPKWWGSRNSAQIVLAPTNLSSAARRAAEVENSSDDIPTHVLSSGPPADLPTLTQSMTTDSDHPQKENS